MSKVLVTGATGFIGNYVVPILLLRGHEVITTSSGLLANGDFSWYGQVTHLPLDFNNLDKDRNYFEYFLEPDCIIHLAWQGLPNYQSDFHINENLPSHKIFLQSLFTNGLTDITITGTCYEYGLQEGELLEDATCKPVTQYGEAKNQLLEWLIPYSQEKKVIFKWLRLFYLYGEGQGEKALYTQMVKAVEAKSEVFNMSLGKQERDFLPVQMLADFIVTASLQKEVTGVINCCSGMPVTVEKFVEDFFESAAHRPQLNKGYFPYPTHEPMCFWGNDEKLKKILSLQK